MIFFIIAAASLIAAVFRVQLTRAAGTTEIRSVLIRMGFAYLAHWLLETGILGPGSPLPIHFIPPTFLVNMVWGMEVVLAVVLLLSVAELAVYGLEFRFRFAGFSDKLWTFGIFVGGATSLILGTLGTVHPSINPLTAAVAALPALVHVRWRSHLTPGLLTATALTGLLFVTLYFVELGFGDAPIPDHPLVEQVDHFRDWVLSLSIVYLILALPRLAWGVSIQIQSVRTRLLVSHLLAGVVPVVLVAVFWGLSTFLSVNGDRAQVAARHIKEQCRQLSLSVHRGLHAESPTDALQQWAALENQVHPGIRLWVEAPPPLGPATSGEATLWPAGWSQVFGTPIVNDEALAEWPADERQETVLILGGRAYIGAYARRRVGGNETGASKSLATIALIPMESVLDQDFSRVLEADAFLDIARSVDSRGAVLSIVPDTLSLSPGQPQGNASMGAALVELIEWKDNQWTSRSTLVWTKVGFFEAIRGLTRNLQDNQFNLIPLLFLGVVAFLFVLVELLTLGMVISMGRSITRALGALEQGTTRIREGNLRYRIPIEGEDDLWALADSFNRMSGTLEQARDLEIEKERLEGELAIAHQIQARLLPSEAPVTPRTELAGLSIPAREVGGDYYDFIPMDGERIGLIVADVSGKGVPAALLMSSFRASLLSQDLDDGPAEALARLNNFLYKSVEPGRFVTAFLAIFETASGRLTYANAGHNPPYLIGTDRSVRLLREGGLVLGLFGESRYEQATVQFREGDTLSLFTDGVTEAQSPEDELWGEDRFLQLMLDHIQAPCRRIVSETLKAIREFAGGEAQSDDVTIMIARWKGHPVDDGVRDDANAALESEIVG